jgi:CheY-like chemotaxis protein/sRNA-binding carbon storage regulator CsrA
MTDKKQLLLVEDDMFSAETLKYAIEAKGHEVIMATNGRDALNIVRKKSPQLVLLDIMMPKMDGYHLCRFIKFDTRFKHIPVIFVSSKIQEADKKLGFTCGGDEYVTKPYDINNLVNLVDRYLGSVEGGATQTPNAGGTFQGGAPPMPNQGGASQGSTPPTPNQGEASQGVTPSTPSQSDAYKGVTPPMPNQNEAYQGGTSPQPNQGETYQSGSTPTPNQGETSQGGTPPTPNQGEASQGSTTQTMMAGETFVIRDNAKITVLNIDREKVQINFNDSDPVTIYVHENKAINEDVSVKIIKTDMDLVELEIIVSDKTERSKKWFF